MFLVPLDSSDIVTPDFLARSAKKFCPTHNLHINANIIVLQTIYVEKVYKKIKINFGPLATLREAVRSWLAARRSFIFLKGDIQY
jgi:hypothetical protein